jgi:hypothetical protein
LQAATDTEKDYLDLSIRRFEELDKKRKSLSQRKPPSLSLRKKEKAPESKTSFYLTPVYEGYNPL